MVSAAIVAQRSSLAGLSDYGANSSDGFDPDSCGGSCFENQHVSSLWHSIRIGPASRRGRLGNRGLPIVDENSRSSRGAKGRFARRAHSRRLLICRYEEKKPFRTTEPKPSDIVG
jgi:hypothetical protein